MAADTVAHLDVLPADHGIMVWARDNWRTYTASVVMLGVGYGIAWIIHLAWFDGDKPFEIATGVSTYALLFVLALVIERLVQPFSPLLGPSTGDAKKNLREARVADGASQIANAEEKVDDARNKTAVVTWGLASGLGFVLSSLLNVTLLGAILKPGQGPWYWVDLLITGLVIGAGTKPLNDLVTRLQDKSVK